MKTECKLQFGNVFFRRKFMWKSIFSGFAQIDCNFACTVYKVYIVQCIHARVNACKYRSVFVCTHSLVHMLLFFYFAFNCIHKRTYVHCTVYMLIDMGTTSTKQATTTCCSHFICFFVICCRFIYFFSLLFIEWSHFLVISSHFGRSHSSIALFIDMVYFFFTFFFFWIAC